MARNYSNVAREAVHGLTTTERPLWLLEIEHPKLQPPARTCEGTEIITHLGNEFLPAPFSLQPPDAGSGPRAKLSIHHPRAMYWAERAGGGAEATVRLIHVLPSEPDTVLVEYDNIKVLAMNGNGHALHVTIGYGHDLRQRLVAADHDSVLSPGLH
jgi:hypothetical protein